VPNLIGDSTTGAEAILTELGLEPTLAFAPVQADSPDVGSVIRQDPGPGSQVRGGSAVTLTIGTPEISPSPSSGTGTPTPTLSPSPASIEPTTALGRML
jgi:beta-lactam-binding protein with PASTA domain